MKTVTNDCLHNIKPINRKLIYLGKLMFTETEIGNIAPSFKILTPVQLMNTYSRHRGKIPE